MTVFYPQVDVKQDDVEGVSETHASGFVAHGAICQRTRPAAALTGGRVLSVFSLFVWLYKCLI